MSPGLQNLLHVPAYGLLVGLTAWAAGLSRLRHLALAAAGCVAFGGLLECAQAAIPGRLGSLADVLLNVAGSAAGAGAVFGLRRLTRRTIAPPDQETAAPIGGELDELAVTRKEKPVVHAQAMRKPVRMAGEFPRHSVDGRWLLYHAAVRQPDQEQLIVLGGDDERGAIPCKMDLPQKIRRGMAHRTRPGRGLSRGTKKPGQRGLRHHKGPARDEHQAPVRGGEAAHVAVFHAFSSCAFRSSCMALAVSPVAR